MKIQKLNNKNVLFIAPRFYNYHTYIIDYMKQCGAIVDFYEENVYTPTFRVINRISNSFGKYLKNKYINDLVNNVENDMYDIVFVIRGGILTASALSILKKKLPKAEFIMYQWDSLEQNNYKSTIEYFNVVNTFDKKNAQELNLGYLPLYYTDNYQNKQQKNYSTDKIDIIFIGAYHSDRLEVIKKIETISLKNNFNFKFHLFITKMGLLRNLLIGKIKISDLKYLKTYSLSQAEILSLYKKSFSVLDIELNIQNGLTMRTFETLASGLKLITTNSFIKEELIYDTNNIFVINRQNIELDLDFFKTEFKFDKNIENYSFENWFNNLFIKGKS